MNQLKCFTCSWMFRERRCLWGDGVFPLLTISSDPLWVSECMDEGRARPDQCEWVLVEISCVAGASHCTPGLRVCSGLGKVRKLKPCLMVKIVMNFFPLLDVRGSWCSVVTSPQGNLQPSWETACEPLPCQQYRQQRKFLVNLRWITVTFALCCRSLAEQDQKADKRDTWGRKGWNKQIDLQAMESLHIWSNWASYSC